MGNEKERVYITDGKDIAAASFQARRLSEIAGFNPTQQYMIATSVSELATNIYRYAKEGEITIRVLEEETKSGIEIVAEDNGPGITDIEKAMQDGFSTSQGLGIGLPGVKRMMDEFSIDTEQGTGTKITTRKWTR